MKKKKKKKKKNGTPIFGEWDSYFLAGTPTFYKKGVPDSTFKILVRTLDLMQNHVIHVTTYAEKVLF